MDGRIELQNLIRDYISKHPEMKGKKDAEIISILIENGLPDLTPAQKISIYEHAQDYGYTGFQIEHSDSITGKRKLLKPNDRKNPFDPKNMTKEEKAFIEGYRKAYPDDKLTDVHILAIMKLRPYTFRADENYISDKYGRTTAYWALNDNGVYKGPEEKTLNNINRYSLWGNLEIDKDGRFIFESDGMMVWNDITKQWEEKYFDKYVTRYFAADGTEITKEYYEEAKAGTIHKTKDDKMIYMKEVLDRRHEVALQKYYQARESQGLIGMAWNGLKNFFNVFDDMFGNDKPNTSSMNIEKRFENEKQKDFGGYNSSNNLLSSFLNTNDENKAYYFKRLTGEKYSEENVEKLLRGEIKLDSEKAVEEFEESQNTAVDTFGDIVSGVASLGIYTLAAAAAPFSAGASIAVGVGAATLAGGLIKSGIKFSESLIGGKEYKSDEFVRDLSMGGFSGLIAPFTGGLGGAVGKGVAKAIGIQALKHTGKMGAQKAAESGVKGFFQKALLNPTGYEYVGGTMATGTAFGAEIITDGALSGGIDTAFRTKYDGGSWEESLDAGVEGLKYGAIFSPIMGFGMKAIGKAGQEVGLKKRGKEYYNKYTSEKYIELSNEKLKHLESKVTPEAKELFEFIKSNDKIKGVKDISENLEDIVTPEKYTEISDFDDSFKREYKKRNINPSFLSFRLNLLKKYVNDERFGVDENFTNMVANFVKFRPYSQKYPPFLSKVIDDLLVDSKYATKNIKEILDFLGETATSEQSAKDITETLKYCVDSGLSEHKNYKKFIWDFYKNSKDVYKASDEIIAKNLKAVTINPHARKDMNKGSLIEKLIDLMSGEDEYDMLPSWYRALPLDEDLSEMLSSPKNIEKIRTLYSTANDLSSYAISLFKYWEKEPYQLTKKEKKEYIAELMKYKKVITSHEENILDIGKNKLKKANLNIPLDSKGYVATMQALSNSLNISYTPLSPAKIAKFNHAMNNLMNTFKTIDLSNVGEIKLKIPHAEFVSKVNKLLKDLSPAEQAKICDFYGFQIRNQKLSGYPSSLGKEFNSAGITDSKTLEVLKKMKSVVDDYTDNNYMFVENNSALNKQLKEISEVLPEIFNQIDGSKTSIETFKALQRVVKHSGFDGLSESDKKVMMVATLLHNTDKSSTDTIESAFDAFFIAKKFNLSDKDAQKVYTIIQSSDVVEKFMATSKNKTNYRDISLSTNGQNRQDTFDLLAFQLKEENNFELAQMLYSSKQTEGFTRFFDKAIKSRIDEIKASDFMLPQTPKEKLLDMTITQTIKRWRFKKAYKVQVVRASNIRDFYAFAHTPDVQYSSGGNRSTNFANFWAFNTLNDDKIICTSYIGRGKYGLAAPNGFLFTVGNKNQHVAFGKDIYSTVRNIPQMVVQYLRDKGLKAKRHRGELYEHRTMASNVLKTILYNKDYYKMTFELDAFTKELDKKYDDLISKAKKEMSGRSQTAEINKLKKQKQTELEENELYKAMEEMDKKYIQRVDNIKAKLGDKEMTMENLREIDSKFAEAYETFLKRDGANEGNVASLLRSEWHNEVLVSNPEISAIYTKDIDKLPEEYFIKAEQEGLPIVILD